MTIRNLPKEFDDVGRSLRTTRIAERSIILGRTLILSISGCIAIDAIIRFPSPLRWLILLGLTLFTSWLFRRQFLPVFAPASSRVQLALEVEKGTHKLLVVLRLELNSPRIQNSKEMCLLNGLSVTPSDWLRLNQFLNCCQQHK